MPVFKGKNRSTIHRAVQVPIGPLIDLASALLNCTADGQVGQYHFIIVASDSHSDLARRAYRSSSARHGSVSYAVCAGIWLHAHELHCEVVSFEYIVITNQLTDLSPY